MLLVASESPSTERPRDHVWRVLTEEEHIVQCRAPTCRSTRPGARLTERWADASGREVLTSGEVVRLGAPRTLELRGVDDDWDEPMRVLFRLEESANTTRLMPEHSGWEAFSTSLRADQLLAHASGWSQHMANLAAYLTRTPR